MTGGCRRAAVAAVTGALLSVALAATTTGAAAAVATAPLVRAAPAVTAPSMDGLVRQAGGRIPCDYTYTDTVVVDAPCKGECGFDRQYRVNRLVKMWPPGAPKTEKPLFHYTRQWLCTPTRALEGAAKPGRKPLTCMALWIPDYEELCKHMPAAPGCGWKTAPRLKKKVAKAIKAEVQPPEQENITQCRKTTNI